MRLGITSLVLIFCCTSFHSKGSEVKDSLAEISESKNERGSFFEASWRPVGLSLLSVALMTDSSKFGLQTLIRQPFNGYTNHADDYLQYVPGIILYSADLFGAKSKNTVWNQTKYFAMSELFTAGIVHALKLSLKVQRPNNGAYTAYPSGHTSQAFVQSQVLYNEFKDSNKLLAYSGFLFSMPTGALRIINNKHWLPDVLLGAGIAMLVTNTVYYFEPLKNWNPWKKKNKKTDIGFIPTWNDDYFGGYLSIKF
ncbi:MAG: phosphatase PAP2 family protein [Crocinitomicaceae bacterium]|nr:phosphatase PAP2 family protein [Crocinitomicaceae bacterium]